MHERHPNSDWEDAEDLAAGDRSRMGVLLRGFSGQLSSAWELASGISVEEPFARVLVCGMGGSAIGGDFLRIYLQQKGFSKPINVVRGYELPPFADERTLVFAVSYSGNTEETLSCTQQALERGCTVFALTSGGQLATVAEEHGMTAVRIPGGMPPRTALGYLFAPLLRVLLSSFEKGEEIEREFQEAVSTLRRLAATYSEKPETENPAKRLARALFQKIPVIYGSEVTEASARRWKGQINENAKQPAYWDVLPELHHNEIMSWESPLTENFVYVLLRDPEEHPQVRTRFALTRELLAERGRVVLEAQGEGKGLLSRLLSLSYLGDWVSYYLALLNGVDPTPVALIERMKRRLNGEEDLP